ncbi:MAG: tetratricopeptide repeat protein [Myxococcota bacterium]
MAEVRLPKGQSLRDVAKALGLEVETLQAHAQVEDVEAIAATDRVLTVPDGFLRSRAHSRELRNAVSRQSARKHGMNTWLAMDIEQKRTRIETALGQKPSHDDKAQLEDAIHAFLRFDAESNRLALDLLSPLETHAKGLALRGQAATWAALAHARRTLAYGEAPEKPKLNALSSAKVAVNAEPKNSLARVAMGLSLWITPMPGDADAALEEMYEAAGYDPGNPLAWCALTEALLHLGDVEAAETAAEQALMCGDGLSLSFEVAGRFALHTGDAQTAIRHLQDAVHLSPANANANLLLALAMTVAGRENLGRREAKLALDAVRDPAHLSLLQDAWNSRSWPRRGGPEPL